MIKRYTLLFLFALLAAPLLRAQAYVPMLDSAINEWTYATVGIGVVAPQPGARATCTLPYMAAPYSDARDYTQGDTVLNSNVYKVLYHEEYFNACLLGFIREDTATRKVYFRSHQDLGEYVLYDFSQQPGDSMFFNFDAMFRPAGWYYLDSISTISITGGQRRAFHYSQNNITWPFRIIESVGSDAALTYNDVTPFSMGGPFQNCPGVQHQFSQFLACFNHSGHVYYDTCAYTTAQQYLFAGSQITDSCRYSYFSGAIQENNLISRFDLQPNPATDYVTISLELFDAAETGIQVYDLAGRVIFSKQNSGKTPAGKSSFEVSVSALPQGVFFVGCTTPAGTAYRKLVIQR